MFVGISNCTPRCPELGDTLFSLLLHTLAPPPSFEVRVVPEKDTPRVLGGDRFLIRRYFVGESFSPFRAISNRFGHLLTPSGVFTSAVPSNGQYFSLLRPLGLTVNFAGPLILTLSVALACPMSVNIPHFFSSFSWTGSRTGALLLFPSPPVVLPYVMLTELP